MDPDRFEAMCHPKFTRFLPWNGGVTIGRIRQAQALLDGLTGRGIPPTYRVVYVGNYRDMRSPALVVDDGNGCAVSALTVYVDGESGELADRGQFWVRLSVYKPLPSQGWIQRVMVEDGVAREVSPKRVHVVNQAPYAVLYELLPGGLP
jgi:hypothetical protein